MKKKLTVTLLKSEAGAFSKKESLHGEPSLYGVTDGKAVGTYFEHKFRKYLRSKYAFKEGSSAKGIIAFMTDRCLPVDDIQAQTLAEEILANPPEIGYLTISNALQWRLQYRRAIDKAGDVEGVQRII